MMTMRRACVAVVLSCAAATGAAAGCGSLLCDDEETDLPARDSGAVDDRPLDSQGLEDSGGEGDSGDGGDGGADASAQRRRVFVTSKTYKGTDVNAAFATN